MIQTKLTAAGDRLRHMRIVPKLFLGYVLLIWIPFAVLGFVFYKQLYDNLLDQYKNGKTQLMERAYRNLEVELTKMEAIYPLFQNNTNLTEYLGGVYADDWDSAYDYKKEIGPTFSYAYIGNQLIDKITVYKTDPAVPILAPEIEDMDHYVDPVYADDVKALPPNRGLWAVDKTEMPERLPGVRYVHKLYNDSFTRVLGYLQLTLNDGLIKQFFQTLQSDGEVWRAVLDGRGQVLFQAPETAAKRPESKSLLAGIPDAGTASFYTEGRKYLVSAAVVQRWNLTIVEVYEVKDVLNVQREIGWSIIVGIALLCILSVLYFMIASSLTLRILRFTRHMKRVEDPKTALYAGESGSDEIGFLISTYNAMMLRVDELKTVVTQTELLKKEAEIRMLQAQINPHFLYNTLDTMRMLALVKGDDEVAEIGLKLGKLLRYSLSKTKDVTTLAEELENVEHYLDIHRLRMGERLVAEVSAADEALRLPCPRFILQPLVENSILHGFRDIRGTASLRLVLSDEGDAVMIRLSDSGSGIPEDRLAMIRKVLAGALPQEQISSSGGIGLYNVNERIKAFYGEGSGMEISSRKEEGTLTVVRLEKKREVSPC